MDRNESLLVLTIFLIYFVIPVYFLIIADAYSKDECNNVEFTPNLSLYLTVQNLVYILHFPSFLFSYFYVGDHIFRLRVILGLLLVFDLGWSITGSASLSQNELCQTNSPLLYYSALVCNIMSYVILFCVKWFPFQLGRYEAVV